VSIEAMVDLRGGLVADRLLHRIVLEIDGPHGQTVKPVLEHLGRQVTDAEDGAKAQDTDRLEVVGEEVRTAVAARQQRCEGLRCDRRDEVVDVCRDDPRLVTLVEASAQLKVPFTVHRHEGWPAEGAINRRIGDLGGEHLRPRGHRFNVGGSGDEPGVHRRNPRDGRLCAKPAIDRIWVGFEIFDGDRCSVGGHGYIFDQLIKEFKTPGFQPPRADSSKWQDSDRSPEQYATIEKPIGGTH
jgi:hypothetical protein